MTTEEIVEAVSAAGFSASEMMTRLAAFKRLIEAAAAAEREACFQICTEQARNHPYPSHAGAAITVCASAIRSRGQK